MRFNKQKILPTAKPPESKTLSAVLKQAREDLR